MIGARHHDDAGCRVGLRRTQRSTPAASCDRAGPNFAMEHDSEKLALGLDPGADTGFRIKVMLKQRDKA
jgi:hypothetical protein